MEREKGTADQMRPGGGGRHDAGAAFVRLRQWGRAGRAGVGRGLRAEKRERPGPGGSGLRRAPGRSHRGLRLHAAGK